MYQTWTMGAVSGSIVHKTFGHVFANAVFQWYGATQNDEGE